MKKIDIYTDGCCLGNPGKGGWAAILIYGEIIKEIGGYALDTTNNQMELTAAISALKALKEPCAVRLFSDSQYLCNAVNKNWITGWRLRGWKTSNNKPIKNLELWLALVELLTIHQVQFIWIKGHAGCTNNERCDELANAWAKLAIAEKPIPLLPSV